MGYSDFCPQANSSATGDCTTAMSILRVIPIDSILRLHPEYGLIRTEYFMFLKDDRCPGLWYTARNP